MTSHRTNSDYKSSGNLHHGPDYPESSHPPDTNDNKEAAFRESEEVVNFINPNSDHRRVSSTHPNSFNRYPVALDIFNYGDAQSFVHHRVTFLHPMFLKHSLHSLPEALDRFNFGDAQPLTSLYPTPFKHNFVDLHSLPPFMDHRLPAIDPNSIDHGESPLHPNFVDHGEAPLHSDSIDHGESPLHPDSIDHGEAPLHSDSIDHGESPLHPDSIDHGETPFDPNSIDHEQHKQEVKYNIVDNLKKSVIHSVSYEIPYLVFPAIKDYCVYGTIDQGKLKVQLKSSLLNVAMAGTETILQSVLNRIEPVQNFMVYIHPQLPYLIGRVGLYNVGSVLYILVTFFAGKISVKMALIQIFYRIGSQIFSRIGIMLGGSIGSMIGTCVGGPGGGLAGGVVGAYFGDQAACSLYELVLKALQYIYNSFRSIIRGPQSQS